MLPSRHNDIARLTLRWMARHYRRYLGVFAAIVFAVASFILVMSLSDDIKNQIGQNLDLTGGVTIFQVYYEEKPPDMPWTADLRVFFPEVAEDISKLASVMTVAAVAPKTTPAIIRHGSRTAQFGALGVDEYFWQLQSYKPRSGRFFTELELERGERVCVIGSEVARTIFDAEDVAGRTLIIENDLYTIVGVLDGLRVREGVRFVFLPMTTALRRLPGMALPLLLFVRCKTWDDVEPAAAAVPQIIAQYLPTDRLRIEFDPEVVRRVQRYSFRIETFARISVLVAWLLGGLGVWNIMTASVRSRTREIGLKKAMGARDSDILSQFVTETASICLVGAAAGVLGGLGGVGLLTYLFDWQQPVMVVLKNSVWSVVIMVVIGMAAGLYPSILASRVEVSASLRHE